MWLKHSEAGEILILVKNTYGDWYETHGRVVHAPAQPMQACDLDQVIVLTRLNQSIDAFQRSGMFEARKK
jgi:hypothetical protein